MVAIVKRTDNDDAFEAHSSLSKTVKNTPYPKESLISEQAILGAVFNAVKNKDKTLLLEIFSTIKSSDFRSSEHKQIFQICLEIDEKGGSPDTGTVSHLFAKKYNEFEDIHIEYIFSLESQSVNEIGSNFIFHLEALRKSGALKELGRIAKEIECLSHSDLDSLEEVDAVVEASIQMIKDVNREHSSPPRLVEGALDEFLVDIERKFNGQTSPYKTGYEDLDELLGPLEEGNLIVLGGRPSMGKTTFALNIANNCSIKLNNDERLHTQIFSLEMPEQQVVRTLTSMTGKVNLSRLKSGQLLQEDWAGLNIAINSLSSAKISINDEARITPFKIKKLIEESIALHGTKFVIIDYLQLMSPNKESMNRQNDVASMSRDLKVIAKELGVIIILLAQLSRDLEKRTDKRPIMADLRESGAIEQDADIIIFLYRDVVYNPESECKGITELLIRKNRSGETGDIRLYDQLEYALFTDFHVGRQDSNYY